MSAIRWVCSATAMVEEVGGVAGLGAQSLPLILERTAGIERTDEAKELLLGLTLHAFARMHDA